MSIHKHYYWLIGLFLLITLGGSSVGAAPSEPLIRIGLWSNQQNVIISADSPFSLITEKGEEISKHQAKEKLAISLQNNLFSINHKLVSAQSLIIQPDNNSAEPTLEVNRRKYRGTISIHPTIQGSGMTVVNTLAVEKYLYGIIAREISPDWAIEAIKAQAVAARTYALYSLNKHKSDGYDVCATTDCQVYGGIESEAARSSKAVDETRGVVLRFEGKLIPAFFHASSGGYTENSENVWGTALPYLKGVSDFDQQSPHYRWTKELTPQEMTTLLAKAGYILGDIQTFTLSRLDKQPVNSSDRGISGRVKSLRVSGTKGTVVLTGNRFRSLFGLNSTLFDLSIVTPPPASIDIPIVDSFGDRGSKKMEINLKPLEEKAILDNEQIRRITGRPLEKVIISGYGWGHGLGLSQWGAKAMAEQASSNDSAYFKQILKHYYQGVDIVKIY